MFKYFCTRNWALWAWGGLIAIVLSVIADVQINVWFNGWYGRFMDLLQTPKDINLFWALLISFSWMAGLSIVIGVLSRLITNFWMLKWRTSMVNEYTPRWKKMTSEKYEGSSQRLQEDTKRFAGLVEELGELALNSILTMISFIPILLVLGTKVTIPWLIAIPGNLATIAILISGGGLLISWLVGIKLPILEYNNQMAEAAYRKPLVYGEDDKSSIDLKTLGKAFDDILANYKMLFFHYTYFNTWKIFYYQFNIILPYLLMAPSLFAGLITLGVITQTVNAFGQVHSAASFLISRWRDVTELRSVYRRLREFERALPEA
jgi:peptide/bleomycin uptake transporter